MKVRLLVLLLFISASCNTKPQPLVAGKDICSYCKMPVADLKFGGELITNKGKLYTYDDIGCLLQFLKTNPAINDLSPKLFVVDYTDSRKLLDVNACVFLKSNVLHSPMNSGTAAFESHPEAEKASQDFPGEIVSWLTLIGRD